MITLYDGLTSYSRAGQFGCMHIGPVMMGMDVTPFADDPWANWLRPPPFAFGGWSGVKSCLCCEREEEDPIFA